MALGSVHKAKRAVIRNHMNRILYDFMIWMITYFCWLLMVHPSARHHCSQEGCWKRILSALVARRNHKCLGLRYISLECFQKKHSVI